MDPIDVSQDDIQRRLLFVGDAGDPDGAADLLSRVGTFLDPLAERTTLVFLGDNVYRRGAVIVTAEGISRALQLQLDAGTRHGKTLFVPGNHDWDSGGLWSTDLARGHTRLSAMERYVATNPQKPGRWLPRAGCPGPESVDLEAVKLVAIDSQWWLLGSDSREKLADTLDCRAKTEPEVIAALEEELGCAEPCPARVLIAHHPLQTHGRHGGYFAWYDHLLCVPGVPVPLPVLCSLYILARRSGVTQQDLSSGSYDHFVTELGKVLDRHPPLAYVAGHEHNLQVLRDGSARLQLVSGSGSKSTAVRRGPVFRSSRHGFMTLDFLSSGGVLLKVYEFTEQPQITRPSYQEWIVPARSTP